LSLNVSISIFLLEQCSSMDRDYNKTSGVVSMAQDAYANYVVRTALEAVEIGEQRDKLFDVLISSLDKLVRDGEMQDMTLKDSFSPLLTPLKHQTPPPSITQETAPYAKHIVRKIKQGENL
jgi:hypothetical protein